MKDARGAGFAMAAKQQWGNWVYDPKLNYLDHTNPDYPIRLNTDSLALQVYQWLRQIHPYTIWVDGSELNNLLIAFHEVFSSRTKFRKAFDNEIKPRMEHWRTFCNGVHLLIWDKNLDSQGWNQQLEKLYMDFTHSKISDVP